MATPRRHVAYLTTVRSSVDRASLWKVMMTEVGGKSLGYFFLWHLQQAEGRGQRQCVAQGKNFESRSAETIDD